MLDQFLEFLRQEYQLSRGDILSSVGPVKVTTVLEHFVNIEIFPLSSSDRTSSPSLQWRTRPPGAPRAPGREGGGGGGGAPLPQHTQSQVKVSAIVY